jgi:hypothetical protein
MACLEIVASWAVLPMRHPSRADDDSCALFSWGKLLLAIATTRRLDNLVLLRMHLQNMGLRAACYYLRELRHDARQGKPASTWLGRRRRYYYLRELRHDARQGEPASMWLGRRWRYGEDSEASSEDPRPESEVEE